MRLCHATLRISSDIARVFRVSLVRDVWQIFDKFQIHTSSFPTSNYPFSYYSNLVKIKFSNVMRYRQRDTRSPSHLLPQARVFLFTLTAWILLKLWNYPTIRKIIAVLSVWNFSRIFRSHTNYTCRRWNNFYFLFRVCIYLSGISRW